MPFRRLRDWWSRRRKEAALLRTGPITHACGHGAVALFRGDVCCFCGMTFEEAAREHREWIKTSEQLERENDERRDREQRLGS